MIPFGAMVILLFMLMNQLHLVDSYAGIILPQIATPLSVIVFKRFFDQVPKDFRDAAVIDGANEFRVLFNIYIRVFNNQVQRIRRRIPPVGLNSQGFSWAEC